MLNRASEAPNVVKVDDAYIVPFLDRVIELATIDARVALIMAWAAVDALSRDRWPDEFGRPQSPGRIIERLASEGVAGLSDASFLGVMAEKRNSFVHGKLRQAVAPDDVAKFVAVVRDLLAQLPLSSRVSTPSACVAPMELGIGRFAISLRPS